ncbi:MAG: radical SAM protein [Elusimicrobia bacterium]|nr:radical SAM protein [Elusimicrobiota bacterium]
MTPEPFVPKWIAWEVTSRCNLRCIHCRAASAGQEGKTCRAESTTAEAKALIDDIAGFCSPVLVLSGGEPLLRPDIFELARHGADRGLRMALATNGTLVTDAACRDMKAAGIRIVSLSLDGPTASVHDDFRRQPGAFAGTLKAAEAFRRHGIEFIVNSSFTKRNQPHIQAVCDLAKSIGAKAWYLFMVVPTGRGKDLLDELVSPEDYERILEWHYKAERQEGDLLMRPTCAPHYYRIVRQMARQEGVRLNQRSLSFSTGGGKGCVAAQSIAFIDAHGDVHPCSYFPGSAGNVRTTPFRRIWEDSKLFLSLRDFKGYKGRCGACEFLKVCGGCRARADLMAGDPLAEEPLCGYVPLRMRDAHEKEKPL